MASLLLLTALAAVASLTEAHYTFVRLRHGNEWKQPLQYIRNKTSPYEEQAFYQATVRGFHWPTVTLDRPESIRCGRDNMAHASAAGVLTVRAGDEIEIAHQQVDPSDWRSDHFENCPEGRGSCQVAEGYSQIFNHPGPLVVHLSPVPTGQSVETYDGTGDWVKIHSVGLTSNATHPVQWILWPKTPPRMKFHIPSTTPSGQYLMRMDVIWTKPVFPGQKPGTLDTLAQLYPTCAQLNIINDSNASAKFPKGVKIPEIFMPGMPGMETKQGMEFMTELDPDYVYPGGDLWDGEKYVVDKPVPEM